MLLMTYQAASIIPGSAKADIRVRVRRCIVQIQREHTGIAAIVPIAAAKEATRALCSRATKTIIY